MVNEPPEETPAETMDAADEEIDDTAEVPEPDDDTNELSDEELAEVDDLDGDGDG